MEQPVKLVHEKTGQIQEFSPEEAKSRLATGAWVAFATAALSGATFGASDYAINALTGGDIRAAREESPIASGAGNVAGSIVGLGKLGLVGRGVKAAANKLTGGAVGRAIASAPVGSAVRTGAKVGAQTAAYGVTERSVDQVAAKLKGDAEVAAEVNASQSLETALFEFGLGAATGAAGAELMKLLNAAGQAAGKQALKRSIYDVGLTPMKAASLQDKGTLDQVLKAFKGLKLDKLPPELAVQKTNELLRQTGKSLGEIAASSPDVFANRKILSAALKRAREKGMVAKGYQPKDLIAKEIYGKFFDGKSTAKELQDLRSRMSQLQKATSGKADKNFLANLNEQIGESLNKSLGPAYSKANKQYGVLKDLTAAAQKRSGRAFELRRGYSPLERFTDRALEVGAVGGLVTGNPLVAVGSLGTRGLRALAANPKSAEVLARLENVYARTIAGIDSKVPLGMGRAARYGTTVSALRGMLSSDNYDTIVQKVRDLNDMPLKTLEKFGEQNQELSSVAPEVHDLSSISFAQKINYLTEAIPKSPAGHDAFALLDTNWQPSKTQRKEFLEKVETVLDPTSAIDFATPARLEALAATSPLIYELIKGAALKKINEEQGPSYRKKLFYSRMFGQAATTLAAPRLAQNMQTMYGGEPQPEGQEGSARNVGAQRQKQMNLRNAAEQSRTLIDNMSTRRQ